MSVVSKIFIIVNLLLTLLLLAAMGRKITYDFNGEYRQLYQEQTELLSQARAAKENLESDRAKQRQKLQSQQTDATQKLEGVKAKQSALEGEITTRDGAIKTKLEAKNDLKRRIGTKQNEGKALSRNEKDLQEQLKTTESELQQEILEMKRTINSYFAKKRRREDLEAQAAAE